MTTLHHATFCFHQSLNDFLRKRQKNQWLNYSFRTPSSVKDAIESLGVPHVEVSTILVNGSEEHFQYLVHPDDQIEVFPFKAQFPLQAPRSFILDVHLGKLARLLRMLGIDTFYQNEMHDPDIVALAVAENRSVLTRDVGLLKHKVLSYGYWLRSQQAEEQLLEVIRWFSLCDRVRPFTRCIACNGLLHPVSKEAVVDRLPEQTRAYFEEFYQCNTCGKVYWKGSHYENMQQLIRRITSLAC